MIHRQSAPGADPASARDRQADDDDIAATRDLLAAAGLTPRPIELPDPDAIFRRSVALVGSEEGAGGGTHAPDQPRWSATGASSRQLRHSRDARNDPPGMRHTTSRRRSRRRWRTAAIAVLVLAISGLTAKAILPMGDVDAYAEPLSFSHVQHSSQWQGTPGVEPESTLDKLADAAQARHNPAKVGSVQHTTSFRWVMSSYGDQPASTFDSSWLEPDGTLTISAVREPATADPNDTSVDLNESAYAGRQATRTSQPVGGYADHKLTPNASSDPDALLAQLADPSTCNRGAAWGITPAQCLAGRFIEMHEQFVVPGSVDASMWRALESAGGTRDLGTVTDRAGREGVGISVQESDATAHGGAEYMTLIADPKTGELLGVEYLGNSVANQTTAVSVTWFEYFGDSSWVAQVPPAN